MISHHFSSLHIPRIFAPSFNPIVQIYSMLQLKHLKRLDNLTVISPSGKQMLLQRWKDVRTISLNAFDLQYGKCTKQPIKTFLIQYFILLFCGLTFAYKVFNTAGNFNRDLSRWDVSAVTGTGMNLSTCTFSTNSMNVYNFLTLHQK